MTTDEAVTGGSGAMEARLDSAVQCQRSEIRTVERRLRLAADMLRDGEGDRQSLVCAMDQSGHAYLSINRLLWERTGER